MIDAVATGAIQAMEHGWVPDAAIRAVIRRLCTERLRAEGQRRAGVADDDVTALFLERLRDAELAAVPDKANAQHYEVPADLFRLMLGPHMKYSCGWWGDGVHSLADAEAAALDLTARRAGIEDGMSILELGCGWGSLSLWLAGRYPRSAVHGVSNSASQRAWIEGEARRLGFTNLTIETADMNQFTPPRRFDRIVSVEMFEHMRNYHELLDRIHGWLQPGGRLFVHVFSHRRFAYLFEEDGPGNWMGRHFFSGGLMPSADLLPSVPSGLALDRTWSWDGRHYERTANAWLANLDARRERVRRVLDRAYGESAGAVWFNRWRIFLMACAELFGYADGTEWGVTHYLFARTDATASSGALS